MKNNYFYLAALMILFVPISISIYKGKEFAVADGQTQQIEGGAIWETKTDDRAPVSISVTPIKVGDGSGVWEFLVSLDTHAGDLDGDILKKSFLKDDAENVYSPIEWEGPGPGGHHIEGVLRFKALSESKIRFGVRDIGGVPERWFVWERQ